MSITSEQTFETAIIESLLANGGYTQGNASDYSPELGMFKAEILQFLRDTQPKQWDKLAAIHGNDIENRLIQRLYKELDLRGALDVVRNGIVDYGVRFKMAFFKPESGLNPDTLALYTQNRLKVIRQVHYSKKNTNYSVDLVLSLNGLPVATLELKNRFTGQNTAHAKKQYASTRDNKELLFTFKKRSLVHFAVDDEEVYMTTRIDGSQTHWLPFNKGHQFGAGNPPNPAGYRSDYLWRDILQKDSWLEIIGRFIHLQVEEFDFEGRTHKKEKLIFPRFHQLDAVHKITAHAQNHGAGHNYLVQHSAGSGKSNTIAWLSYRLSGLHDASNQRIFDSVIVVTDRRVLDSQLQNTIYQFEHKSGVVQRIDKDSQQLADAIGGGTNIIITTLQKFPYVIDKVGELPNRKYAVIIDEAHSSQGGEASKKMKAVLAGGEPEIQEPYPEYDNDDGEVVDVQELVNLYVERSAAARGRQSNLSFFAFTATPKYKTLAVFGYKDADGKPQPFHLYSMRQAIEEGFILDVLQNYTTYQLYFKLSKAIEDDPKINKKKAAQAIGRFVALHPHNLAQKTEIIIEHFRQVVTAKIGGRAKAMLVSGSRLHAKRYFEEFNRYIKEKGYERNIKILVAFSGRVVDDNFPDGVTESQLTGFGEKELPRVFADDDYKILIVADKYQTGFDQPLLHTLYVDKALSGVKAVQTLSRLNRTAPGKEDTFVLDFVNDRQTILDSFQPYYEVTCIGEEPEPNHLYDLKVKLDEQQVYLGSEIDAFAKIYFNPTTQMTGRTQSQLYSFIDPALDRYKAIDTDDEKEEFKKSLRTWTNLYAFLAQIMPFREPEFEKFYAYAKLLLTKLPKRDLAESMKLTDEVALEYYRLQKIKDGSLELITSGEGELDGLTEAGIKRAREEKAALSEIIDVLNDRFGTEFEEADRLFFAQIETELMADATLQIQAKVNQLDTFKYAFEAMFIDKLIERMDQNQEIFEKILENQSFGSLVKELMMKKVYARMNEVQEQCS
ncbi:type I restriction endonuclease subunit R [Methylomonas sp. LL1]|uniref:type I restriction endonuclease subunit R n=1 Tax=Methylomonas sp. LL1 TaxID=2785785 RepID=UPI0018C3CCFB|nr:type I restriction endonuclease [Methylomonas sp. LL1]QPK62934.1 type I restriction endonuclease subunit R [Methylomonas sp. LL1]